MLDTEPLAVWWESAPSAEQKMVSALPTIQRVTEGRGVVNRPYDPDVRDALLDGRRHVWESEMKDRRRSRGRPGHEARPE